ncbi:MAG: signal peptidase II [Deltaproteobacteria bacterium]|nr:signal peptidase II [Deltaproteobacteria bacterium]
MLALRGGVEINYPVKILAATAAPVIIADLVTKELVMRLMTYGQSIPVVPGLFNLVYYKNPGAAFSVFASGGVLRTLFLIGSSVVALIAIAVLLRRPTGRWMTIALSLIAGGATGNLIDRVRFGWVVDFLDFYASGYHWPAFNAADSAITVGVGMAIVNYYIAERKKQG